MTEHTKIHSRSPVRPSPRPPSRMEREQLRLPPWASHLVVTHNARQGGDSPADTGPDHALIKEPPISMITHNVRHHVARATSGWHTHSRADP